MELLYVRIMDSIKDKILNGELEANTKLPNTLEMAEQYGVSHQTVRLAMAALAKDGLITRTRQKGTFVSDISRKTFDKLEKRHVFLLVSYPVEEAIATYFAKDVIDGVIKRAEELNYRVDLHMYSSIDTLTIPLSLTGFLLLRPSKEQALSIKRLGLPTVMLDMHYKRIGLDSVRSDNRYGIFAAVKHLVKLGHRRILYVHSCLDKVTYRNFSAAERYRAFIEAAGKYGLPLEGFTVPFREVGRKLTDLSCSAVITDGRTPTLAAVRSLAENNIRLLHDVSFVGYDDIGLAEHVPTPLTVVRQRLEEVGTIGLDLLLNGEGGRGAARILVRPELVIRGSTRQLEVV
ncbi:MAG: GntR family transcriptional regulator [bacterium]|nr:GntR family transcriptional regulator [bacterium]